MKLEFYSFGNREFDLRPNSPTRTWMDNTDQKYAYRCLPLNIANAHGWSFHLTRDISVLWNGTNGLDGILIDDGRAVSHICSSAFGHGILTFFVPGIFRTEEGWNIMASGAPNTPFDGAYALSGVIETDWSPYSFTMNWQITRKNHWITFKKGMPFCSVFPVQREYLQEINPVLKVIDDDQQLKDDHALWSDKREQFIKDLSVPESTAAKQRWQKDYFRGKNVQQEQGTDTHLTKLRLKEFKKEE
ncbi:MAG: DUF6065 family protein [Pseudomonadota bacterium]